MSSAEGLSEGGIRDDQVARLIVCASTSAGSREGVALLPRCRITRVQGVFYISLFTFLSLLYL